jgi:aldehyde dehydrogenase (NAD+)
MDLLQRVAQCGDMTDTQTTLSIRGHWINGAVARTGGATANVMSPVTGAVVATVPSGTAEDVDAAVIAAHAALPAWAATAPKERARIIGELAQRLTERTEEIAQAITAEIGAPIMLSRFGQAGIPVAVATSVAGLAADVPWTEEIGNSLIVREPVG